MATLTSEYQYLGRSARIAPRSGSYGYYVLLYAKTGPDALTGEHVVSLRQVLACTVESSFYLHGSIVSGSIGGASVFYNSTGKLPNKAWEITPDFSEGGVTYRIGTVVAEGTLIVDASDGAPRNIVLATSWQSKATSTADYVPASGTVGSVSVTATLAAIPRKSSVTATDAYIGSTSVIMINKTVSTYTHTLSYRMAGESVYTVLVERTAAEQYGFTVPTTAYNLIPSDREIAITVLCETFNGDVSMGTTETVFTASVRESASLPSVTATAEDVNALTVALTGDAKTVVRGFSNLRVQSAVEAKNGASVASVRVTVGGRAAFGEDVTIDAVENATVSVTVTDSRGFPNTYTITNLTLIDYIPLTVNPTAERPSPGSDVIHITATGNYYNGSFGHIENALTVHARFRPYGGTYSDPVALSVSVLGNTYVASGELTGVSYSVINEVEVVAYDAIYTDGKAWVERVKKGTPIFDWGEKDFAFHVPFSAPSELPPVLVGTATTDSMIDDELAAYGESIGEGAYKTIYLPSGMHSLLGSEPVLVDGFNNNYGTSWQKITRASAAPILYVRSRVGGVWRSWTKVGGSDVVCNLVYQNTAGTTSVPFNPLAYDYLFILATPKSGNDMVTLCIPVAYYSALLQGAGTDFRVQAADNESYTVVGMNTSGVWTTEGTGRIRHVSGIKFGATQEVEEPRFSVGIMNGILQVTESAEDVVISSQISSGVLRVTDESETTAVSAEIRNNILYIKEE